MQTGDMVKIGERFKAIREAAKLTQGRFGEVIGMQQSAVSSLEKGERMPTTEQLIMTSRHFYKSVDWILYGSENQRTEVAESHTEYSATVSMPVYALAGAGAPCCIDALEPIGQILVEHKYNGPNIRVIQVRGSSMEPTLLDGSYVGVDVTDKNVISGKLYAVYLPYEGTVVKRIWIGPELVKIESDNKTAPSHDMSIERVNWDTFIQGRVKWWIVQES
jgi:transcriptional regulator with XRE-family HTH domain